MLAVYITHLTCYLFLRVYISNYYFCHKILTSLHQSSDNILKYSTVQRKLYIEYRARFAFERETFERVSSVSLLESRYLLSFAKREARFESSRCELKKFSRNEIRVSSIRELHDLNALLRTAMPLWHV